MQAAAGTELIVLGDQGVLFHEPAQKLYRLNTAATYIWCLLEDGLGEAEINAALQDTFSLSIDEAAEFYRQSEVAWNDIGVLADSPAAALGGEVRPQQPELINMDVSETEIVAERDYYLLSSAIRVRFTSKEQLEVVDPVLRHLQNDRSLPAAVTLDIVSRDGKIFLCRDSQVCLSCDDVVSLAPLAKSLVWQTAVLNHDFFLDIHAGVVGDGRQCFVFPAAPGSGKSSLVTALVANGFEFFSDEIALIHEGDFSVSPAPLSICVKDPGVDVIAKYYPQVRGLQRHYRSDGKWVRYLPPPQASMAAADSARPVGAIVFPRYKADAKTFLSRIESIDALQRLMDECLIVSSQLDVEKVRQLVAWVDATPCYTLELSDSNEAVALMQELAG